MCKINKTLAMCIKVDSLSFVISVPTSISADFKVQPSSFTSPVTPSDMKPHYPLATYATQTPSPYFSIAKPTIKPTKIVKKEDPENTSFNVVLKTEPSPVNNNNNNNICCNLIPTKTEQLVVKPELPSVCRSNTPPPPPPPQGWVNSYDSYMNHDSNSSSVSSMDTLGHHHQLHPSGHLPVAPPPVTTHHMPAPPVYVTKAIEESRNSIQHRSPYEPASINSSEDGYHRPDNPSRSYPLTSISSINRPIPSYSTEIASHTYEVAGHRPYDPGSTTNYDRYDATPQPCPPTPRYPDYQEHELRAYDQQHHQMSAIMKPEHPSESESSDGPLYPRYFTILIHISSSLLTC